MPYHLKIYLSHFQGYMTNDIDVSVKTSLPSVSSAINEAKHSVLLTTYTSCTWFNNACGVTKNSLFWSTETYL